MTVIDCDPRVLEPATLRRDSIDPGFGDRALRIERADGVEMLVMDHWLVAEPAGRTVDGLAPDRRAAVPGGDAARLFPLATT